MKSLLTGLFFLAAAAGIQADAQAEEWTDLTQSSGEALFGAKCGMCHRASGMGTVILSRRMDPERALLENRDDLQGPFIETVVRNGFNIMFPLSRGEVSDEQLQKIIEYLTEETR